MLNITNTRSTLNTDQSINSTGICPCSWLSKWAYTLLNQILPQKRPHTFSIQEVSQADYPTMAKIAREWQRFSIDALRNKSLGEVYQTWHNLQLISKLVAQSFEYPEMARKVFTHAYACYDESKNVQGFLLLREEETEVKIAHLVSNPRNINSPFNRQEAPPVRGVGTALVEFTKRHRCIELGKKTVYLDGLEGVGPFYEKLGFAYGPQYLVEDGDFLMEWTSQNGQKNNKKNQ